MRGRAAKASLAMPLEGRAGFAGAAGCCASLAMPLEGRAGFAGAAACCAARPLNPSCNVVAAASREELAA
jgi:hypothetical protein